MPTQDAQRAKAEQKSEVGNYIRIKENAGLYQKLVDVVTLQRTKN